MNIYRTSEIAQIIGIHPNTVRLYEKLKLIPKAKRQKNGYRVFTDFHLEQLKLARTALRVEVLQNGLRKKVIDIIKTSAAGNLVEAIKLTNEYLEQIRQEQRNAREAVEIAAQLLAREVQEPSNLLLKRKEAADYLKISMDTLRNWELNGLLTVKRKQNGYRVYTSDDIKQLKIIRSLRCADYSLSAILRMLSALSRNPKVDIKQIIDTPNETDDIISAYDKLLTSLQHAETNAKGVLNQLSKMKNMNITNPPL